MNHTQNRTIDPYTLPSAPLTRLHRLPQLPGIYFAIRDRAILYIGKANNLRQRWERGHHKEAELLKYGEGVRIAYLVLTNYSETQLYELEDELIKQYCPRLNIAGLPGFSPIEQPARKRPRHNPIEPLQTLFYALFFSRRGLKRLVRPTLKWGAIAFLLWFSISPDTAKYRAIVITRLDMALTEALKH